MQKVREAVMGRIESRDLGCAQLFQLGTIRFVSPYDRAISRDGVVPHAVEEGHEAVVILLCDWIFLVIVAAGAS